MSKLLKKIFSFTSLLFVISMFLFISVSWKIALGIMLFGWMMNIENEQKNLK